MVAGVIAYALEDKFKCHTLTAVKQKQEMTAESVDFFQWLVMILSMYQFLSLLFSLVNCFNCLLLTNATKYGLLHLLYHTLVAGNPHTSCEFADAVNWNSYVARGWISLQKRRMQRPTASYCYCYFQVLHQCLLGGCHVTRTYPTDCSHKLFIVT